MSPTPLEGDNPLTTHTDLARRYRTIQGTIADYAIGLAILGLNPIPHLFTLTLIVSAAILLKMIWDIAKGWYFPIVRNPITLAGGIISIAGALAIAFLAWLTMVFLSVFFPILDRFAFCAALLSGTWSLGVAANQFFLNGFLNRTSKQTDEEIDG
ncbi:MAG: hypothetical protein AB4290_17100 [Spirulina sp.]